MPEHCNLALDLTTNLGLSNVPSSSSWDRLLQVDVTSPGFVRLPVDTQAPPQQPQIMERTMADIDDCRMQSRSSRKSRKRRHQRLHRFHRGRPASHRVLPFKRGGMRLWYRVFRSTPPQLRGRRRGLIDIINDAVKQFSSNGRVGANGKCRATLSAAAWRLFGDTIRGAEFGCVAARTLARHHIMSRGNVSLRLHQVRLPGQTPKPPPSFFSS